MIGVPANDERCERIKSCDPEMPGLDCPVAEFTLAFDPKGIIQRMVRHALVRARIGSPLRADIQMPFDGEQRPFDRSDFPWCDGQVVLTRIRSELLRELAWRHHSGHYRGHFVQESGLLEKIVVSRFLLPISLFNSVETSIGSKNWGHLDGSS